MLKRAGSIALVATIPFVWSTNSFADNCRALTAPAERLECFDRAFPPISSAEANRGWELRRSKDSMTDKETCYVHPSNRRYIQIYRNKLYVSYQGRGGAGGYIYRVDEHPASEMRLTEGVEKQIGVVRIGGEDFRSVIAGSRLRVETITLLNAITNEDVSIADARPVYTRMLQECGH